jgi:hypothetical protein
LNLRDIESQAKALAPIMRGFVSKSIDALKTEIFAAMDERLSSINVQPWIDDAVVKAISAIPMPTGIKGDPGADGVSVSVEAVQAMVDAAVEKAFTEVEIVVPEDGKDGKDALEIDILPRIDAEKSYPRGTWATHNGGVWRAHATTEGMRGWECVMDGVNKAYREQIDVRNFADVVEMASGKVFKHVFAVPAMIYKGIWKEGFYQQGDTVTWGGSLWHCDADTDTKPGDTSKHWTLCAKKGRDAK